MTEADQIIKRLGLTPHPEGGHYRQTWADDGQDRPEGRPEDRPAGTCIYFLLRAGEVSHWHRVDAAEIWHFYTGAPLILSVSPTDSGPRRDLRLGPGLASGEEPQHIVPPGHWQMARSTGAFTLVGCTVSPGFLFEHFELAPPGFDIP